MTTAFTAIMPNTVQKPGIDAITAKVKDLPGLISSKRLESSAEKTGKDKTCL